MKHHTLSLLRILALALGSFAALAIAGQSMAQGRTEVRVGFFVTSVSDVDPVHGSFDLTAFAWSVDPSGTFNPVEDLQVLARRAEMQEVERITLDNGSTYVAFKIVATVDQSFDLQKFPFDKQVLSLMVEAEPTLNKLVLVPDRDDTVMADFVEINGWVVRGVSLDVSEQTYDTSFGHGGSSSFSRLTLDIALDRHRSGVLIEKFMGFMVALLISGLIYIVPADQIGVRVGLVTSSILTAVGNRYGLDALLGERTGFGLVDQLTLIVFAALLLGILNTIMIYRIQAGGDIATARRINMAVGLVVVPVSALLCFWVVLRASI